MKSFTKISRLHSAVQWSLLLFLIAVLSFTFHIESVVASGDVAVDSAAVPGQRSRLLDGLAVEAFLEQQKLNASDGAALDYFGAASAVDGNTTIFGAPGTGFPGGAPGSAYVFTRIGSTWSLQQKLTASDGANGDGFGASVAISGDRIVVGAPLNDVGTNANQGSAYVFVRSGTTWSQQQQLAATDGAADDEFGNVSISGQTVIVGARFDDLGSTSAQGSAYIFSNSGTVWTQQQKITASDGATSDGFGTSVALAGETAIIGALYNDVGLNPLQGAAYVFVRTGVTWTQQQKLTSSDGAPLDSFGFSVAVSGETAIIGTLQDIGPNQNLGTVYIFVRGGTTWTEQQKLMAADGAPNDAFGASVAISGDTAVVGAQGDNVGSNGEQGSAYLFVRNGSVWTQDQKLTASEGGSSDSFGASVATSGGIVAIGAVNDVVNSSPQGSGYVFSSPGFTVSGHVTTPAGLGLRNAAVSIIDSQGLRRTVTTSTFGFYTFDNVASGAAYTVAVQSKRFRFASRAIPVTGDLTNVDFVAQE